MKGTDIRKFLMVIVGIPVVIALIGVLVLAANDYLHPMSVDAATDYLEDQNYVVFSAEDFALVAKEATAYAAVQNANAAVIAAQAAASNASAAAEAAATAAEAAADAVVAAELAAAKVDLFNTANTFLFPADTDYYVLLTANAAAGNFSTWAEITDNNAVNLSSRFAGNAGYISDIYIYQVTAPADTTHIVEIAYGSNKTSLTRIMFNGDNLNIAQIKSRRIPAGETIYYRIMTNTAPTEYVSIGFRYFYE
jgi:hypothetical protein